jgi:hypothetical protein
MISEATTTQFSLTISDSTGVVCSHESRRHMWKLFLWWFLSRQRLSFRWLFLIPLHRGCVPLGIHLSPMKAILLMNSESAATQFSLTIFESTWAVCSDEITSHMWKRFCWQFLRRQQLCFPWLFLSQQGQCALTNPGVTSGSIYVDDF